MVRSRSVPLSILLRLRPVILVAGVALLAACVRTGTPRPPAAASAPSPQPSAPRRASDTAVSPEEREQLRQVTRDAQRVARERTAPDSIVRRLRTDSALPTAFADTNARVLLALARTARLRQDSALVAYRATTTQRFDVALGARRVGLEKRLLRGDNVAEIAWRRDVGVRVTPLGSRLASSLGGNTRGTITDAVTIPYFPGRETLWYPSSEFGVVRSDIDERDLIHPLASGAETYYRYASGDSATIRLPDGTAIPLQELRITARRPDRRLFVGSFWFDRRGGELVRAAYRLAAAIEIWDVAADELAANRQQAAVAGPVRDSIARARLPRPLFLKDSAERAALAARAARQDASDDEPPRLVTAVFSPARAELEGITVEYGLHEGRFWLPRAHSASYRVQFGFIRVPYQLDETFRYQDINAPFPLRPIPATRLARARGDTVNAGDSTTVVDAPAQVSVSIGGGAVQAGTVDSTSAVDTTRSPGERQRARLCARDSVYTRVDSRFEGRLRVAFDMPCNGERLRTAAVLPALDADDLPGTTAAGRDALLDALGLSLQPGIAISRPTLAWGTEFLRYNRIEGLSVGAQLRQSLGAGYTVLATGRIGAADRHGNGELALERRGGTRTVTATLYHRLAAVNPEWAGALSLGPSLPALLYGRDEGFYYRTYGASLAERRTHRRGAFEVQAFLERQWAAGDSLAASRFSFAKWFTNRRFRDNILASNADLAGVTMVWSRALVDRPAGLRMTTTTRTELATGTYTYARQSVEGTIQRPLGPLSAALSGGIGSSAGRVPIQRNWFLGGVRTVRGQIPGTQVGNAFWMARAEVGSRQGIVRPMLFFDAGWAGPRDAWVRTQPQRGAGLGFGLLDGLLRVDLARGIAPARGWRMDLYLDGIL